MMRLDKKENKRLYSKNQIQKAFFILLEQESYQHLTIAMILDESQISRRTFYRHYSNKQAIVEDYLESL
ncbi:TetR/AcrR family transcriptional regulator [Streptococcus ovis]|uniref:TetR/AcrR family transcriptional regulator n=1 Tax=Streptococcus ovis TaxID=82806 RepID=UPI00146135F6|nr:TetR/AcrR family transcriptional regulator [Streptococcus ovis]